MRRSRGRGEALLVASLLFYRGAPRQLLPFLEALHPSPPNAAAARDLHHVDGNVVALWFYPRRERELSDSVVYGCFSATGK